MSEKDELRELIKSSDNIVFFGGAGVSTESGIPDFRSVDGLYNQKYDYPPETILSHDFFISKPDEFYRFYRDKILSYDAKPNKAHLALAKLEEMGKLKAVVTQNIDLLHHMAESKTVYELHGTVGRNYCMDCHKEYGVDYVKNSEGVPHCDCGGIIKPDVVLYQEMLNEETVTNAIKAISEADVLIVGGTSLTVYPAAGFTSYYKGDKLVLINMSSTALDSVADLRIQGKIGEVLGECVEM